PLPHAIPPDPPPSPLLPYATLFRSDLVQRALQQRHVQLVRTEEPAERATDLQRPQRQSVPHTAAELVDDPAQRHPERDLVDAGPDRKSTRLNSSHVKNSYAVFCLKQKIASSHSEGRQIALDPPNERELLFFVDQIALSIDAAIVPVRLVEVQLAEEVDSRRLCRLD